jgi:hypothetical protein
MVVDRSGNLYIQPAGLAAGSPGPFASLTVGWLLQEEGPSEEEVRSFNEGLAFSGGGAAGLAVDLVWSPDADARTKYAFEFGLGSPRAGVSAGYAAWATRFGIQW